MKCIPNFFSLVVGITCIAGCGGDHYLVQSTDLSNGQSLVTDAKSRAIISFADSAQNGNSGANGRRIICAEPSPDVAQAIADALKVGLQLDLSKATGADPSQTKTLGADFGKSSAASVAQLGERLAVIQLLRDKMYRACEAYANHAIGEASYTLMLARHDKTMMSLLSNELAAGAFGRALASIGSSASTGGADPEALKKQQAEVVKKADALKAVDTSKKEEVDKATKELQAEVDKLIALERMGYTSANGQSAQGSLGQINGLTRTVNLEVVGGIHQNYIDDDGLDPLMDACIIGMEGNRVKLTDEAKNAALGIQKDVIKAQEEVTRINNRIADVKKEIREHDDRIAYVKAKRKELEKKSVRSNKEKSELAALNIDLQVFEHRSKAGADELQELEEQRNESKRGQDLALGGIFVSTSSPFAAFCYQSVLSSGSQFVNMRMKQKRMLRGVELTDDTVTTKKLDFCTKLLTADEKAVKEDVKKDLLTACKNILGSNQAKAGK